MSSVTYMLSMPLTATTPVTLPLPIHAEPKPKPAGGGQEHEVPVLFGVALVDLPQFVGSRNKRQTLLLPWLALEGEHWFIDTSAPQAGFSVWKTKTVKLDVLAQPRYGFEPDGDPLLAGLDDRRTAAEAGVRTQWSQAGYTAQLGYYTGVGSNTEGQAASLGLSYEFVRGPWSFIPALEWRWEDRALVNHQYGINAAQARAGRPAGVYGQGNDQRRSRIDRGLRKGCLVRFRQPVLCARGRRYPP